MSADALLGRYAAVSAGSALAAGAAMQVVREGGNAVDAAIAGSAVQCVVEMPWCGVAGDAFAVIRLPDGSTVGFNGSGAAPADILDALGDAPSVPRFGPVSVGVPAIVDAWVSLHDRFGSVPFDRLIEPARRYAADGVPFDRRLHDAFATAFASGTADELRPLAEDVGGLGSRFRQTDLAGTLEAIGGHGREEFYRGVIAKQLVSHVADRGGALALDDLAAHAGEWCPVLSAPYRDAVVHTNAPVSTGVLLLCCLRALDEATPGGLPGDDVAVTDLLVRLKHIAFRTLLPQLGDPRVVANPDLLAADAIDEMVTRLQPPAAAVTAPIARADDLGSDTTSIAVSSPDGMVVTFIHSLFNEFGARELVPGTGVVLNDRLANLRPGTAANSLQPGKRPMHTLHNYLVDRADGSVLAGATPGGRGQVQTNLQVLVDVLDRGSDLQSAVDRPRWVNGMPRVSPDDTTLYLESAMVADAAPLTSLGHEVEVVAPHLDDHFGNCTIVGRDAAAGRHEAAADARRDGHAQVW